MSRLLFALVISFSILSSSSDLMAHSVFKKAMNEAYPVMKISCNACHVKGQKKNVRNDFGELFFQELKSEKLTKNWTDSKANGRSAQKEYEKTTMVPLFEAALKKIKTQTVAKVDGADNPNVGKTYHELIETEKIDGVTIDQKKKEKMEMEMKAAGDKGSAKKGSDKK